MSAKPVVLYLLKHAEIGGAPLHVVQLATRMRADYDVHLCIGQAGPVTEQARQAGLTVHLVEALGEPVSLSGMRRIAGALDAVVAQVKPDLVHVHSTFLGIVARWICSRRALPCVLTVHGWNFVPGIPWRRRLAAWVLEFAVARLRDPYVILVSDYDRRVARRALLMPEARMQVIHNGVPDRAVPERRPACGRVRLLMVARFVEQKDHALLIRALHRVQGEWQLELAGQGETLDHVRALADELPPDRVRFIGQRDDVPALLASSDIFLLISHHEGLPLSIIEAMSAAMPVLATAVGGVDELVQDGLTGLLHRAGDETDLALKLQRLIDDPALRQRLGEAGRARYQQCFTESAMLAATQTVYRRMLAPASP